MSWGTELWDRCDSVFAYTANGIDSLENDFSEYIKERSVIEAEYAKKLKKLSNDYSEKCNSDETKATKSRSRGSGRKSKEPKQEVKYAYNVVGEYRGFFKRLLAELWCIASQHENFSESLMNETYISIQEQVKIYKEIHRNKVEEHIKCSSELAQSYVPMEKTKDKFLKAFQDKEKANGAYESFTRGSSNRKELQKLHQQAQIKTANYDSTLGDYANQMLTVNQIRSSYYGQLQPDILNKLQLMEEDRVAFLKRWVKEVISKQREMSVSITNHCNSLHESFKSIQPEFVTSLFLEITKSGDVPPCEFNFENMNNGRALVLQDVVEESKESNLNLYPKKRNIELQLSRIESDLPEKRKKLEKLQNLKDNNQEGSNNGEYSQQMNIYEIAAKIDSQINEIQKMENNLTSLDQQLSDIDTQLLGLRRPRPYPGSVSYDKIGVEEASEIEEAQTKERQDNIEKTISVNNSKTDDQIQTKESNEKIEKTLSVESSEGDDHTTQYQNSELEETSKLEDRKSQSRKSKINPTVLERLKTLDFDDIPAPDF